MKLKKPSLRGRNGSGFVKYFRVKGLNIVGEGNWKLSRAQLGDSLFPCVTDWGYVMLFRWWKGCLHLLTMPFSRDRGNLGSDVLIRVPACNLSSLVSLSVQTSYMWSKPQEKVIQGQDGSHMILRDLTLKVVLL